MRDVGRAQALELAEQLGDVLPGQIQFVLGQPADIRPLDHVHLASPAQAPMSAHRHPREHPVAGAALFDAEVDDEDVHPFQVREFGIDDAHLGVEHLRQRQHFAGPLFEAAQAHGAGVEVDRVRLDRVDPEHRDENTFARG